jgi:hypothetical protein
MADIFFLLTYRQILKTKLTDLILERVLFYFSVSVAFLKLKCPAWILEIVSGLVKRFLDGEYVLCGRYGNQGMVGGRGLWGERRVCEGKWIL